MFGFNRKKNSLFLKGSGFNTLFSTYCQLPQITI